MWITPDRALVYSSINYFRNVVSREISQTKEPYSAVVVDCSQVTSIDFTTARGLKSLVDEFKHLKKPVLFYNPNPAATYTFVGACSHDIVIVQSLDDLHMYVNC